MKRAYRGLYGNRMIQFGNKISFAENKTRRTWKPNVQKKTVFSETLQRKLTFRMTTHVIRCIRKFGGIDQYLIKTRDSEIKYPKAIELKEEILAIRKQQHEQARDELHDNADAISVKGSDEDVTTDATGEKDEKGGSIRTRTTPGDAPPALLHMTTTAKQAYKGLLQVLDF